jgi:ribonuclease BN (tRNA processing enzyme)
VIRGLEVTTLGVRGSIPVPDRSFYSVGGHTSCVAIGSPGEPPRLLLDAGTGIQNATARWGDQPFDGAILLTHMHWDHVIGIPFFRNADREGARTLVGIPHQTGLTAGQTMDRLMSPPHFPIDRHGLQGEWQFEDLHEEVQEIAGYSVRCREIPHKGGRTFGFRVEGEGASIAYLPDHAPCAIGPGEDGLGELHDGALELAEGVDVLIHGGHFTAAELELANLYGHATIEYALGLADAAKVGRLALTHHSPARTDEAVRSLEVDYADDSVSFAREGDTEIVEAGTKSRQLGSPVDSQRMTQPNSRSVTRSRY